MPKAETTFRPVGNSEQKMHGTTAILICGFTAEDQKRLRQLMDEAGLNDVPAIYIIADSLPMTLAALATQPPETHTGKTAELPQALIVSGLTEQQLHAFMDRYRESGLNRPLWASVTPTSEAWTLKSLLVELLRERESLRQANATQRAEITEPSDKRDNV